MPELNLAIAKQKQLIRQRMHQLIINIAKPEQISCAKSLVTAISIFNEFKHIAIYRSIFNELSLEYLIKYYQTLGGNLYQPIAFKGSKYMDLLPYQLDNRVIFTEKLKTKDSQKAWYNLDIIYVPIVAIDKLGYRLGRGGGYYDVLLSSLLELKPRPIFCGVGYNRQLVESLPTQPHDIALDYFLSEAGLIKF